MREPFDEAEIARYSESERWQYFESQKEYWDNYSIMTTALNKGLAQGRAEGFAEGEAKARECPPDEDQRLSFRRYCRGYRSFARRGGETIGISSRR